GVEIRHLVRPEPDLVHLAAEFDLDKSARFVCHGDLPPRYSVWSCRWSAPAMRMVKLMSCGASSGREFENVVTNPGATYSFSPDPTFERHRTRMFASVVCSKALSSRSSCPSS